MFSLTYSVLCCFLHIFPSFPLPTAYFHLFTLSLSLFSSLIFSLSPSLCLLVSSLRYCSVGLLRLSFPSVVVVSSRVLLIYRGLIFFPLLAFSFLSLFSLFLLLFSDYHLPCAIVSLGPPPFIAFLSSPYLSMSYFLLLTLAFLPPFSIAFRLFAYWCLP